LPFNSSVNRDGFEICPQNIFSLCRESQVESGSTRIPVAYCGEWVTVLFITDRKFSAASCGN
jgi:hypothetical protein